MGTRVGLSLSPALGAQDLNVRRDPRLEKSRKFLEHRLRGNNERMGDAENRSPGRGHTSDVEALVGAFEAAGYRGEALLETMLNEDSWIDVYLLRNRVRASGTPSAAHIVLADALERYTEARLRQARQEEVDVLALLTLTSENHGAFFAAPVRRHAGLQQELTCSDMFSLLKYGDVEAVQYFAAQLATLFLERFPHLPAEREQWAVTAPAGHHEPGAAEKASFLLAREFARVLGVEVVPMGTQAGVVADYSALGDVLPRLDCAVRLYGPIASTKRKLILLDDAVVSGATLWSALAALRTLPPAVAPTTVVPLAVLDVRIADYAVEAKLNDAYPKEHDAVRLVLSDARALPSTRTLKKFMQWGAREVDALIEHVTDERRRALAAWVEASKLARADYGDAVLRRLQGGGGGSGVSAGAGKASD